MVLISVLSFTFMASSWFLQIASDNLRCQTSLRLQATGARCQCRQCRSSFQSDKACSNPPRVIKVMCSTVEVACVCWCNLSDSHKECSDTEDVAPTVMRHRVYWVEYHALFWQDVCCQWDRMNCSRVSFKPLGVFHVPAFSPHTVTGPPPERPLYCTTRNMSSTLYLKRCNSQMFSICAKNCFLSLEFDSNQYLSIATNL